MYEEINLDMVENLMKLKPLNILAGNNIMYFDLIDNYRKAFSDSYIINVISKEDLNITRPLFDISYFLCLIQINNVEVIKEILDVLENKDYLLPIFITNSVSVYNYIKAKNFTTNYNGFYPNYNFFSQYCVKRKKGLKDKQIEILFKKLKGDYSQIDLILKGVTKPEVKKISFNKLLDNILAFKDRKKNALLLMEYRHAKSFVINLLIDRCDKLIKTINVKDINKFDIRYEHVSLERVLEVKCQLHEILEDKSNYENWVIKLLKIGM